VGGLIIDIRAVEFITDATTGTYYKKKTEINTCKNNTS
jgi:hypothetical protein